MLSLFIYLSLFHSFFLSFFLSISIIFLFVYVFAYMPSLFYIYQPTYICPFVYVAIDRWIERFNKQTKPVGSYLSIYLHHLGLFISLSTSAFFMPIYFLIPSPLSIYLSIYLNHMPRFVCLCQSASAYLYLIIIISCWQHGYPWPSLATPPYRSSP